MTKNFTLTLLRRAAIIVPVVMFAGALVEANAQGRDPFAKPAWARTRDAKAAGPRGTAGKQGATTTPPSFGAPAITQRIDYYKRLREDAVANNLPIPKVTSVLTLDEMAVTGIFKTPRGYAAVVEATPIKLSYTIYPGEKFFDGQLVAVEENRLVFRKVTKVAKDKFVSSVENKPLRQYTDQEMIQGTAPTATSDAKSDAPVNAQPFVQDTKKVADAVVISPLSEMEKQTPKAAENAKPAAKSKKPVRVASKKKN